MIWNFIVWYHKLQYFCIRALKSPRNPDGKNDIKPILFYLKVKVYFIFQVNANELPPGEYEILAMFDSNERKVGQGPPQQSRYENSKSISYHYDPNQVEFTFSFNCE